MIILMYLKNTLIWLFPFFVFDYFLKTVYQIPYLKMMSWWFKNFYTQEHMIPLSFGFLIAGLILFLSWAGIVNTAYLSVFGQKQSLAFLGASNSLDYWYIDYKKMNAQPMRSVVEDNVPDSFQHIYRPFPFIKDPGVDMVGVPTNRFTPKAIASLVCFLVLGICFMLPVLHFSVLPVMKQEFSNLPFAQMKGQESFTQMLTLYNLSIKKLFFISLGSIFAAIFFAYMIPKALRKAPVFSLPSIVKPEGKLSGIPVEEEIETRRERKTHPDGSTYEREVETGNRIVYFRFDDPFSPSVYVRLLYYRDSHAALDSKIEQFVKEGRSLDLVLDENLKLKLPVSDNNTQ